MIRVKNDITGWKMWERGVEDSRLVVMSQTNDYVATNGKHYARFLCRCNCGSDKDIIASSYDIRHGKVKSCGCLWAEIHYETHKKYNKYNLSGEFGVGYCSNTGSEFYFDLDDYDLIKDYCWCEVIDKKNGYRELKAPKINGDKGAVHMHQLFGFDGGDHIDKNPLNNRRNNLRMATTKENNRNRNVFQNNTSGIMGVNFEGQRHKWRSRICVDNQRYELGFFLDKQDAIKARLEAEKKYYGKFAPQRHLFKEYGIEEDDASGNN